MKKSTVQLLSFVSGLTIASVAVGVTVSKNQAIRTEIESQLNNILSITKPLLAALKSAVINSKSINAPGKIENSDTTIIPNPAEADLDSQWDAAEKSTIAG